VIGISHSSARTRHPPVVTDGQAGNESEKSAGKCSEAIGGNEQDPLHNALFTTACPFLSYCLQ
jgi:hypothetical protein